MRTTPNTLNFVNTHTERQEFVVFDYTFFLLGI